MSKKEFDDIFSDIDNIIPPTAAKVRTAGASVIDDSGKRTFGAVKLGELVCTRKYENEFIKEIQIRTWGADFSFYNDFLQFSILNWKKTGSKCDYVSFFSFTPQFTQMNKRQYDYYLWFRENARHGQFINADFSYILLWIYEIINIPASLSSPTLGSRMLAKLWRAYRRSYPQLDKYLSEWMADFCIINGIDLPKDIISGFLPEILGKTSFPEYYISSLGRARGGAFIVLSASDYNYRRSKYLTSDNLEFFDNHMLGAVSYCFDTENAEIQTVSVIRDSYIGALCPFQNKRRMTIKYDKFTNRKKSDYTVTECVKYIENLIRAGSGIRSRIAVDLTNTDLKSRIEDYFSGNISSFRAVSPELTRISDRRYEPESSGFSSDEADRIEKSSRAAAELLEGGIGSDENDSDKCPDGGNKAAAADKSARDTRHDDPPEGLSPLCREALSLLIANRFTDFKRKCLDAGILPDAVAEEINDYAFNTLGDIVLEEYGKSYVLIEDYREDVEKWLTK